MAFKSVDYTEIRAQRREANLRALAIPSRTLHTGTYAGATTGAAPKSPADRLQALRDLARGEACTVLRYNGYCRCQSDTTVWGHTNTQADQKGTGYKGHDSAGFFVGGECHSAIDSREFTPEVVAALVSLAQIRTRDRLREIAASRTEKLWKVRAARWALEQIESRK